MVAIVIATDEVPLASPTPVLSTNSTRNTEGRLKSQLLVCNCNFVEWLYAHV